MIDYTITPKGIAILSLNMKEHPTNVFSMDSIEALRQAVDRTVEDNSVKGAIITSAKKEFLAGADLNAVLERSEERRVGKECRL